MVRRKTSAWIWPPVAMLATSCGGAGDMTAGATRSGDAGVDSRAAPSNVGGGGGGSEASPGGNPDDPAGDTPDSTPGEMADAVPDGASAGAPDGAAVDATTPSGPRPIPDPIHGVTLDCGYLESDGVDGRPGLANLQMNIGPIVDSLGHLSRKPTTRVVTDPDEPASKYVDPLTKLHPVSYIMLPIVDASHVDDLSVDQYSARTTQYLDTLGNLVDLWEVGNEVNGDWTGDDIPTVAAKVIAAYDLVHARGYPTALTLVHLDEFNGCDSATDPRGMVRWAQDNLPARVLQGLDYVLISNYEEDCPDWGPEFQKLSMLFPHAKVGFGEMGDDNNQEAYVRRYYGMQFPDLPNYIGGYFYWYFYQDAVPRFKPLWSVFDQVFTTQP